MKKKKSPEKSPKSDISELRRRATRLLDETPRSVALPLSEERRLRQELEIHQVELELQNEELRNARGELETGLDRYTQLFDFAPIGYATLDGDGTIRGLNHVGATMFFENRARLIGRRFAFLLAPYDRTLFGDLLRDALASDTRETREFDLLRPNDSRIVVRLTAATLAGAVPTVLVAFTDITAEKQAEERLLRADAALRDADRRKDEFLAVLSHELRTPLSTLLTYGQLLRHGHIPEDKISAAAEAIERAARAQARLIDDLLDVSRIVAGKLNMKVEAVSLASVARVAVDSVSEVAQKKGVELLVDLDPALPPVAGDPERLRQAVTNLLNNAVKFTPMSGQVRLRVKRREDQALVQVQDTGTGIDSSFLPRIFDRFSQADRTLTRSAGGLGLGLSIARSIIEAHKGSIRAASPGRGKGSTFTISLPLDEEIAKAAGAPRTLRPPVGPSATIRGTRLLIVEDDEGTRETLTEILSLAGAEVRSAEGGDAAMRVLKRFQPDVLVCDIGMPDEDGCSLLRRIRARGPKRGGNVRALALTAFAGDEDRARALAAGFETHLVKPVDVDDLISAVARLAPGAPELSSLN
ncbi:MAG: ATP-binding protein [Polyangiaceae bacterium]